MRKIGLGIIGLGYIGQVHLDHAMKLQNARVVGAADLSRRALRQAAEAGIKRVFTDYGDLIKDPEVDAVVIGLPTHLHLECVSQAAEANKHVFLEKPIARNVQEAQEIIAVARRNSVRLMMGYPLRFNTEFIKLRERIYTKVLGDIEVAQATFISSGPFLHRADAYAPVPVPEWWFHKELTGGGALIDLGSHLINLLRWYFGEITQIRSLLGYRFNLDLEDHAICIAQFENGTTATITVGWFSQEYRLNVELHGSVTHGSASHITETVSITNPVLAAAQLLAKRTRERVMRTTDFRRAHFAELIHFVQCIGRDVEPSPSGREGLRDIEAISNAYKNQNRLD